MVSMKDIAKRCGVSVATVSKALNGHSDISEATRQTVREKAREMGYFPNSSARALKTNRSFNLGVLFTDRAGNGLTHDYFGHVLDSFKVAAEARGYDLTFINTNRTSRKMTFLEHSRYRGVDGVVVANVDFDRDEVMELVRSDLPVVTIDYSADSKPSVVSDNIKGMRDLVSYVISMGHKRIAYIYGGDESVVTRNRVGSFYQTMNEAGLSVPDEYVVRGDYRNPDLCRECTAELLSLREPPTCILYPDDLSAVGGYNAVRERHLSIPGDISLAGYDGINLAKIMEPQLTTIEQDTTAIGRTAAAKLIGMIEHPKATLIEKVIVEGKLLKGGSVGRLN
ncbi:MAG: LacI family DNA-binding transcriptional regulator [Chordicoccus sp.]